jgi:tetraprenyl-beta-curcumene synthase
MRHTQRASHSRALAIPDPVLRAASLDAQFAKMGNIEGAVAFATFTPRAYRTAATRAMAAYEAALDYLDCLCEMPHADPIANGRQLNQALVAAVAPNTGHADYYAYHPDHDDGGYLLSLLETCRTALAQLPAYSLVADATRRISTDNATYQSLNHGDASGSHHQFERWVKARAINYERHHPSAGLRWWEIGASAGSSLGIFALIAVAAHRTTEPEDVTNIEHVYYPWIGAVNSLLDSFVDQSEDGICGQHRLLDYYASPGEAGNRLEAIVTDALHRAALLPFGDNHAMILAAIVSFYMSAPEAYSHDEGKTYKRLLKSMGDIGVYTMCVMRARRCAASIVKRSPPPLRNKSRFIVMKSVRRQLPFL